MAFDPWGAMSQEIWAKVGLVVLCFRKTELTCIKEYAEGLDVRPTIAQTKAHIKIDELDVLAKKGEFKVDGEIVIKSPELPAFPGVDQGIEVNCFKAAVDPVWYLPGVAARLDIEESTLRRALFEDTGGGFVFIVNNNVLSVLLRHVPRASHSTRRQGLPSSDWRNDSLHHGGPREVGRSEY